MDIYIYIYIHKHISIHIHTHTYIYTCMYIDTYVRRKVKSEEKCFFLFVNKQTIKHIFLPFYLFYVHSVRFNSFLPIQTHTHIYRYTWIYIYMHTSYIYIYIYIYITHIYIYMRNRLVLHNFRSSLLTRRSRDNKLLCFEAHRLNDEISCFMCNEGEHKFA